MMKYKVGMYGGAFDPLHLGHLRDMIRAASLCEELYIVISWCEGRESVSKEIRYRWIHNSLKHMTNIRLLMIEDTASSKDAYNEDGYWEKGAQDIKKAIGKHIDAVFCGNDYEKTGRFERLYQPESQIVYFDRAEVPVSSTKIRENPFAYWDYIPAICRPYYTKKVLIIGGESTGKSTLVQNLALAYNTNFVEEAGRSICEFAGSEETMLESDLEEILLRHKVLELDAVKFSNKLLFIDTDCLITLFYAGFLLKKEDEYARCSALANAVNHINSFSLVLFLEPDVDFVQDGTRSEEIRRNRLKYSEQIKEIFCLHGITFTCISGSYLERFQQAKEAVDYKFLIGEYK